MRNKDRGMQSNGIWVYGHLVELPNGEKYIGTFIAPDSGDDADITIKHICFIKIIPETAGRFIGLKDKNDKEIYEGDMVIADYHWTEPHEFEYPGDFYYIDDLVLHDELTIVGNIHEEVDK